MSKKINQWRDGRTKELYEERRGQELCTFPRAPIFEQPPTEMFSCVRNTNSWRLEKCLRSISIRHSDVLLLAMSATSARKHIGLCISGRKIHVSRFLQVSMHQIFSKCMTYIHMYLKHHIERKKILKFLVLFFFFRFRFKYVMGAFWLE